MASTTAGRGRASAHTDEQRDARDEHDDQADAVRRVVVGETPAVREIARKPAPERSRHVTRPSGRRVDADDRERDGDHRNRRDRAATQRDAAVRAQRERRVAGEIRDRSSTVGSRLAPGDGDERERRGVEAGRERGTEEHCLDLVRHPVEAAVVRRPDRRERRRQRPLPQHEQRTGEHAEEQRDEQASRNRCRERDCERAEADREARTATRGRGREPQARRARRRARPAPIARGHRAARGARG